jgi:bacillithiol system protein YtxJ
MSLFNSVFGSSENQNANSNNINWIALQDLGQLNEIIAVSNEKPVVIFKHSTRCSVSRMALKQFENEYDAADATENYFLDLIAYRDVSNAIASRFSVFHQSPQLLLIKDGIAVYNASHSDIDAKTVAEKLKML